MRFIIVFFLILNSSTLFASYKEALALYGEKKYNESLKMIAQEIDVKKDFELDSPNYDLRFLAAHNHWKLGNLTAAVAHLKKCSEIKNDIADPLIDLSLLMLDSKRYGDANYFAFSALKKSEIAVAYYVLGKSAMKTWNFYRAKEYFEKSISIDPEFGISYNDLGITLMELKKYGEANTAFSAALSILPYGSAEVLNNIGLSFEYTGKLDDALTYLGKAEEKMPENPVIKANVNRVKAKIGPKK